MFGYIKPFKPELRICEYEAYKAVYCGLCGQLGSSYGVAARLTLSYDFTFLSMLHYAVNGQQAQINLGRCYVNPLKKCAICRQSEALQFSADTAAIMLYYKLLDNVADSGAFSKLGWSILRPVAASAHKKAAAARESCDAVVAEAMRQQSALESEKTGSIDAASHPTAQAMGEICRQLSQDEAQSRVLERLGYFVGRYVYLCDALDDLEKDLKSGAYNPLALGFHLQKGACREEREMAHNAAKGSLYATIAEATKAYELLELNDFKPILDNIMFSGMRYSVDEILSKKEKNR